MGGGIACCFVFCVLIGSVGSHLLRNICFLFVCLEMVGGELFVASFVLIRCVGALLLVYHLFSCFALLCSKKMEQMSLGLVAQNCVLLASLLGSDLLCRGPPHRVLYNAGGVCNAHGGGSMDRNQTTH
jgi:hypothetical protein